MTHQIVNHERRKLLRALHPLASGHWREVLLYDSFAGSAFWLPLSSVWNAVVMVKEAVEEGGDLG